MGTLLDVLDQIHTDDTVFPIQLYINRYNDGRHCTRMHAHYCRQITLSLGNERSLDVEGAGIPGGRRHLRLSTGDVVLLDGQLHGVVAYPSAVGVRYSINMFYCTADDLRQLERNDASTCRRGRSVVSVQYAEHVAREKKACFHCGFHHACSMPCTNAQLPANWNAGYGVV